MLNYILGRDTAGLGGKGGPYRLDAGHTVHQLSDEEKNAVPEHIKKAAREMGLRAFKQRLRDIKMSEYDHKLYSQFSNAVHNQVQSLRVILGEHSKPESAFEGSQPVLFIAYRARARTIYRLSAG